MQPQFPDIILASRSPRRLELLKQIVPAERIEVCPPRESDEAGFAGLVGWAAFEDRLREIARTKCEDVREQLAESKADYSAIIAADTTIVVETSGGGLLALEQPPEDDSWPEIVKSWFQEYYLGQTHTAMTAMAVSSPSGAIIESVVKTRVTMADDAAHLIDWYLATGEPRGKAGGYALQGAGGIFVTAVAGSLSNVVGLPLRELGESLEELGIDVHGRHQ